jgi:hypothetical protein
VTTRLRSISRSRWVWASLLVLAVLARCAGSCVGFRLGTSRRRCTTRPMSSTRRPARSLPPSRDIAACVERGMTQRTARLPSHACAAAAERDVRIGRRLTSFFSEADDTCGCSSDPRRVAYRESTLCTPPPSPYAIGFCTAEAVDPLRGSGAPFDAEGSERLVVAEDEGVPLSRREATRASSASGRASSVSSGC